MVGADYVISISPKTSLKLLDLPAGINELDGIVPEEDLALFEEGGWSGDYAEYIGQLEALGYDGLIFDADDFKWADIFIFRRTDVNVV